MRQIVVASALAVVIAAAPVVAQETLTLSTSETQHIAASWQVRKVHIDADAPNIEVSLRSDTGQMFVWRYVVSETVTVEQVRSSIRVINRGEFRPLGKTLHQWLLERIVALGVKAGTISGAP